MLQEHTSEEHATRTLVSPDTRFCVGQLAWIDEDGCPFVYCQGNAPGPVRARFLTSLAEVLSRKSLGVLPVFLVFDEQDPEFPIIVGTVSERVGGAFGERTVDGSDFSGSGSKNVGDRKTLNLEANDQITLKCGKASIEIKKNGKIIIKGTEIVSRSRGANKLKGASVSIN